MTEIEGKKPYEKSDIKEGDVIVGIDDKEVTTTQELVKCVNSCNGKILDVKYLRDGIELSTKIEPALTINKEYKLRTLG